MRKLFIAAVAISAIIAPQAAAANPIGDFFANIFGNNDEEPDDTPEEVDQGPVSQHPSPGGSFGGGFFGGGAGGGGGGGGLGGLAFMAGMAGLATQSVNNHDDAPAASR